MLALKMLEQSGQSSILYSIEASQRLPKKSIIRPWIQCPPYWRHGNKPPTVLFANNSNWYSKPLTPENRLIQSGLYLFFSNFYYCLQSFYAPLRFQCTGFYFVLLLFSSRASEVCPLTLSSAQGKEYSLSRRDQTVLWGIQWKKCVRTSVVLLQPAELCLFSFEWAEKRITGDRVACQDQTSDLGRGYVSN